ncbi:hypothetical protein D3C72_2471000 [compost metagenome]
MSTTKPLDHRSRKSAGAAFNQAGVAAGGMGSMGDVGKPRSYPFSSLLHPCENAA